MTSVTRFGENLSPLIFICKRLWQFLEGSLVFGNKLMLLGKYLKNNRAIWSHWTSRSGGKSFLFRNRANFEKMNFINLILLLCEGFRYENLHILARYNC